jgi:hypothetical protein
MDLYATTNVVSLKFKLLLSYASFLLHLNIFPDNPLINAYRCEDKSFPLCSLLLTQQSNTEPDPAKLLWIVLAGIETLGGDNLVALKTSGLVHW